MSGRSMPSTVSAARAEDRRLGRRSVECEPIHPVVRLLRNIGLYGLTFGVASYTAFAYGVLPLGALVHPR